MIKIIDKNACCGCHGCVNACPTNCISMHPDNEGFLYPQVDEASCTDCGTCEAVCPMLVQSKQQDHPQVYAAWHIDASIRAISSSGGVFAALMQYTFKQGGVVVGAAFDADWALRHQLARTPEEGHKFHGSKYVQSIMGDTYPKVASLLQQGRKVLFTGTPCQVAGLYTFLGSNNPQLVTCDLVCHGVPSPKVFAAYRQMLENRYVGKTQRIAFRRKDCGWKRYSIAFTFENAIEYRHVLFNDPFMIGFLNNMYLRPSCHACLFSRFPRVADISLGDFWGVDKHHPEWDDDQGTSLLLVQSDKGRQLLRDCDNQLHIHAAELTIALPANPCICNSVAPDKRRSKFFQDLDDLPFDQVMARYMRPPTLWQRTINKAKRILHTALYRAQHS